MRAPELDPESIKVLRIIAARGMIRGGELLKEAGIPSPEKLLEIIKPLLNNQLVMTSGIAETDDILSVRFYVAPSSSSYIKMTYL